MTRTVPPPVHGLDEAPDPELIERFRALRDEPAFAELLRRHGPLVWGVCRRGLNGEADAEDAFQMTFLVLVRRLDEAARVRALGPWLHGVATHTVRNLRRGRGRRNRAIPLLHGDGAGPDPAERIDRRIDLDQALANLPATMRDALVLCFLEGRSRSEAAEQLGLSEGTLSSTLARAKRRLRARLGGQEPTALLALAGSLILPGQLAARTSERAFETMEPGPLMEWTRATIAPLQGVWLMLLPKLGIAALALATLLAGMALGSRAPDDSKKAPPDGLNPATATLVAAPGPKVTELTEMQPGVIQELLKSRGLERGARVSVAFDPLTPIHFGDLAVEKRKAFLVKLNERTLSTNWRSGAHSPMYLIDESPFDHVIIDRTGDLDLFIALRSSQAPKAEPCRIEFRVPGHVTIDGAGSNRGAVPRPQSATTFSCLRGGTYGFSLTADKLIAAATLEIYPGEAGTTGFLSRNPIPIEVSARDLERISSGQMVLKAIHLTNALPLEEETVATIDSSLIEPGTDPIRQAALEGRILAVLRLRALPISLTAGDERVRPDAADSSVLPKADQLARADLVKLIDDELAGLANERELVRKQMDLIQLRERRIDGLKDSLTRLDASADPTKLATLEVYLLNAAESPKGPAFVVVQGKRDTSRVRHDAADILSLRRLLEELARGSGTDVEVGIRPRAGITSTLLQAAMTACSNAGFKRIRVAEWNEPAATLDRIPRQPAPKPEPAKKETLEVFILTAPEFPNGPIFVIVNGTPGGSRVRQDAADAKTLGQLLERLAQGSGSGVDVKIRPRAFIASSLIDAAMTACSNAGFQRIRITEWTEPVEDLDRIQKRSAPVRP